MSQYDGVVPNHKKHLLEMPGIGEYTASAVMCFAYNHKESIIDANIARIYRRFFDLPVTKRVENDELLKSVASEIVKTLRDEDVKFFHYGCLDLSSLICRFKLPKCTKCPLTQHCKFSNLHSST